MNFYEITKKFEDVLLDLGYYRDWNYNYLCFYICNTKCFYIDYNHSKFGYKNCVENDSFTEYEYAFYTTEENIKNFLETIQQKAANFIKFIKKEQAINTKLEEIEKDFVWATHLLNKKFMNR